jgi:uncharacterized protein involved in outer membrane biogenesis
MTTTATRAIWRKPIIRKAVIAVLALFALYTVFGFLVLPRIVQAEAPKLVAEKLHRNLSIDKVEINPFTLLVNVHGVKLMEAQGNGVFASFDTLTVKVSAQSLLHFAPVVQEVLLSNPSVHITREDARRYNFDDIVQALAQAPQQQPPADSAPARFSVYNIQLTGGRVEFEDKPRQQTHVIDQLTVGVPFISSLPSQVEVFVEPLLHANVDGAPIHFAGKARPYAEPREALLNLTLADVDLSRYVEYLPFEPRFKVPSARMDLTLNANFRQAKGKTPELLIDGHTSLKSLKITDADGKQAVALNTLDIALGKSNVLGESIAIERVALDGFSADVAVEKDGRVNLQRLFDTGAQNTDTAKPAPVVTEKPSEATSPHLALKLKLVDIGNATLHYADDSHGLHTGLEKFGLKIQDSNLDLAKRDLTIGEVISDSADISLKIGKATMAVKPASAAHASSHSPEPTAATPFAIKVDKFSINNWNTQLEDGRQSKPVDTVISPLSLTVNGWSNAPAALAQVDLKANVNHGGSLALAGKLGLSPLHVDTTIDIKTVDLLGLQPYVTDKVNLQFNSANLSAKGSIKLDQAAKTAGADASIQGGYQGDLTLGNVATIDKITGDDFLRWKTLALTGMDIKLTPLSIGINQINFTDFFARVILDANTHMNLQDIVRTDQNAGKSLTKSDKTAVPANDSKPTASAPAATTTSKPPIPIKIGKLILQNGKARYTDNFIVPHFTANLVNLNGSVNGLSSEQSSNATVDLHGQVNDAPLLIAGTINPLKSDLSLDLKGNINGMELVPLSPYSGRYIGYDIEKGKLSFEVAYQVDHRKLTSQNRLVLDQLSFGSKVDSPKATKLPVLLAVALLRDRHGVIDINLPVGGSLDDPEFSVGGIVTKIIFNAIEKAVTSPFALLGSMFGGGEELSTLPFDPGSYAVNATAETKLKALATAMTERPALKLEISGVSDPDGDRPGLQRAALDRSLRTLKQQDRTAHGKAVVGEQITVDAQEYPALLTQAYKAAKFTKPTNVVGLSKDLPVPEMEKLMLANTAISDDDLTTLANKRAQAAEEWLLTNGKITSDRLFILAPKSGTAPPKDSKAGVARVDFSLR